MKDTHKYEFKFEAKTTNACTYKEKWKRVKVGEKVYPNGAIDIQYTWVRNTDGNNRKPDEDGIVVAY